MRKIDTHTHLGIWNFPIPGAGTVDNLLRLCERYDISRAACSSGLAILYDMEAGNAEVAAAVAAYEQILGYVYVNPNYIAESVIELERYLGEPGFVGTKIYTGGYSGVSADAPEFEEMVAEVARLSTVMLVHTGGMAAAKALARYADKHPTLNIIMGHGAVSDAPAVADLVKTRPNMYFEFCSSFAERGRVERVVEVCGAEQIVFGSDMDLLEPGWTMGMFEDAGLSDEQKQMVYYDNAARLFEL